MHFVTLCSETSRCMEYKIPRQRAPQETCKEQEIVAVGCWPGNAMEGVLETDFIIKKGCARETVIPENKRWSKEFFRRFAAELVNRVSTGL